MQKLKMIERRKRYIAIISAMLLFGNVSYNMDCAEAYWSTPTYGGDMAGYHIYVRRNTGSTLLGIMSLIRNSVGSYNNFTANVNFAGEVHGYVSDNNGSNHLYTNGLSSGATLSVPNIVEGAIPTCVYGHMGFEEIN